MLSVKELEGGRPRHSDTLWHWYMLGCEGFLVTGRHTPHLPAEALAAKYKWFVDSICWLPASSGMGGVPTDLLTLERFILF